MTVPADILTLAPAIANGTTAPPTEAGIRRDIGRLIDVQSPGALTCLDTVLTGPNAGAALQWLESTGALAVWLPEVHALVNFHLSSPVHHKDLWSHTLEVLERTPVDADLRWVALLHDIGKVATRAIFGHGQVSFHGHEKLGAWLTHGIAARLHMPDARRERIAFVVEHHARVNAYEGSWSDRAIRRLIRDAGEHLEDMLRFSSADYTTKRPRRASRIRAQLAELTERIARMNAKANAAPTLPPRLGSALCSDMNIKPGPQVGEFIAWLEAQISTGELQPGQDTHYYVDALRARQEVRDPPL
ncbi:MAG: HDIG domain-containing metalloprotein [Myxococcota bacterium]